MPSNSGIRFQQTPVPSRTTVPQKRSRMPTLFNLIRTSLYGTIILFTVICLALAAHLQTVLAASDLTRFIPFAIFVCTVSLLIFLGLLGASFFLRERNPISTRIELPSLGFAGLLWLILGVYLATSDSQSADVECFASATDTQPLDDSSASFHTDQYQAMYRVIDAFSLINATLILLFAFGLLFLALRKQRMGDDHMWHGPVTSCAWFNSYKNSVKRGNSTSSSILPITSETKEPEATRANYTRRHASPYANGRPSGTRRGLDTEKPLPSHGPMRQHSGNSGHSTMPGSFTSTNEFERGGMYNPNAGRSRGSR